MNLKVLCFLYSEYARNQPYCWMMRGKGIIYRELYTAIDDNYCYSYHSTVSYNTSSLNYF
jgi:hypothetical protein